MEDSESQLSTVAAGKGLMSSQNKEHFLFSLHGLKSFINAELFMLFSYTVSFKHLQTIITLPTKVKK